MERAENLEVFRVEAGGVPFAFDGIDGAPARRKHEIDLVPVLVAPIHDLRPGGLGEEAVEDEKLPEQAVVFRAKPGPAAGEGDEAGVEAIDLWLADELTLSAAGVWADDGGDVVSSRTSRYRMTRSPGLSVLRAAMAR